MNQTEDPRIVCSIRYYGYYLILFDVSNRYLYMFYDGSGTARMYTAPDSRTKAISMMGAYMLEAIEDKKWGY